MIKFPVTRFSNTGEYLPRRRATFIQRAERVEKKSMAVKAEKMKGKVYNCAQTLSPGSDFSWFYFSLLKIIAMAK